MTNTLIFYAGLILIVVTWGTYLAAIPAEKVPPRPIGHSIFMGAGLVLLLLGFLGQSKFSLILTAIFIFGISFGGLFFYLLSLARLPDRELKVAVGDRFIPFEALDSAGQAVRSADWSGQRVLLKFFRGHW